MAASRKSSEGGRLKLGSKLLAVMLAMVLGLTACSAGTPVNIGGEDTPMADTGEVVDGVEGDEFVEGDESVEADDPEAEGEDPEAVEAIEGEEGEVPEAQPEQDAAEPAEDGQEAAEEGAQGTEPASNDLLTAPAASTMAVGSVSVLGYTLTGEGITEADFSSAGNLLTINTSEKVTISNSGTSAYGIVVPSGVEANLVLNGVTVTCAWPLNIKAGGICHLELADGSANRFTASGEVRAPGIHCGTGATLTVDDSVANADVSGKLITPVNGQIPAGTKYKDNTGATRTSKGDYLTLLDSKNPGTLYVKGGGQGAGLGGSYMEDGGNMTFNGGVLTVENGNGPTTSSGDGIFGAGIGGGGHAAGTSPSEWITFNGGRVDTKAAFHGAGVGGGWNQATKTIVTGLTQSSHPAGTGNIRINGGYIKSQGGNDGNGFGRGCYGQQVYCDNRDYTILITGGTMIPTGGTNLGVWGMDIGGAGTKSDGTSNYTKPALAANVCISGGSIYVGAKTGGGYRFDGTAYGSFNEAADGTITINKTEQVVPITIDLTADLKALADDPTKADLNRAITTWELLVAGETVSYGAPAQFDNGKLYLWLTPEQAKEEVVVRLSYLGDSGSNVPVDPLYRPAGTSGSTNLKRYVFFNLQEDFFDQEGGTTEKAAVSFDALSDYEQKKYAEAKDGSGKVDVPVVTKPYDGLPYSVRELTDSNNSLNSGGDDNKPIWSNITYTAQTYDKATGKLGAEQAAETLPTDTGLTRFTLTSTQYSNHNEYKESYYGHRAYGWCQIAPVPAVLTLEGAEWGNLDMGTGQFTPTTTADDKVGNRIKITFNVRSAVGTAPTCKTPTGQVQLKIDGKPFGGPITLSKEEVEKSQWSTYTVVEGAKTAAENTSAAINSAENRWTAKIVYYMDPAQADGLLAAKPSKFKTVSKSDEAAQTFADVLAAGMNDIMLAMADIQAADGKDDNEHKVTAEYLPDKNYIEGVEANPQNADATATIIIPVDTPVVVKDDQGTTYEFTGEVPEGVTPAPGADDGSVKYASVTKNYADFHKKDADGNETIEKDFFALEVQTDSAMPMEWIVSDPSVADLERDANGNVVYDENGNPKVHVYSCGDVTITMHQRGNAVYNEQTRVINLRIAPDNSIPPATEARVIWNNLTHPGMPAAPGDEIEYTIVGSNLTDGSAWQDVNLGDIVPSNVTINPGTVQVARNFGTPEDRGSMSPADLAELDFESLPGATVTTNPDGSQIVGNVGTVYGGHSTAMKFTVTVNPDIVDRSTMTGENPPVIPNTPTASGSYGVKEAQDMAPGEKPGDPKPVTDTVIIGIEPEDELRAGVLPRDPVMGGADAEIYVDKTAQNLTAAEQGRASAVTLPGDKVSYTITVGNRGADSCLYYPIITDTLPQGITPVPGTFKLTRVDGTQVDVADDVYTAASRTVALYVDDLYAGEQTSLTFECTVGDDASTADNMAFAKGTTPSEKWRGEHPEPVTHSDEPVVPDGPKASEILGGTLQDDPAGDGEDGGEPGVTIGDVTPGGPLADAKKADPADPTKPALTDPENPGSTTDAPIMPGDRIVKFGELEPPASADDIAKELDRIIKETIANDPEATEVDIPVTVERPNPDDPDNPIIEDVVVTVPITPEMKEKVNPTPAPPAIDPENPPVPGTPWTPEDGVYVGDGTPTSQTEKPATPGVLIPSKDPVVHGDPSDIKVEKTAENLTSGNDGDTYVGDRVRYTVTVADTKPGTAWFNVVVRDNLPQGIDIDMATAKIVTAAGQEIPVAAEAYDPATRILAVNMGDVPGGMEAKLVFEADVTEQAASNDVGNVANAYGTVPSKVDPTTLEPGNRPQPGSAFNPPEGWDKYDEANPPLSNSEPAYPSKNAKDNGVKPASERPAKDANPAAVGGQDGQGGKGSGSGSDGDGWDTGVAAKFLQLAQTGDPLFLGMSALALVAIAAGIALLATAVRRRRDPEDER